jgi:hypothetical protein
MRTSLDSGARALAALLGAMLASTAANAALSEEDLSLAGLAQVQKDPRCATHPVTRFAGSADQTNQPLILPSSIGLRAVQPLVERTARNPCPFGHMGDSSLRLPASGLRDAHRCGAATPSGRGRQDRPANSPRRRVSLRPSLIVSTRQCALRSADCPRRPDAIYPPSHRRSRSDESNALADGARLALAGRAPSARVYGEVRQAPAPSGPAQSYGPPSFW